MIWDEALRATLDAFLDQPFEWGRFDCCQFAAYYVEQCTGNDFAARFPYDDAAGKDALLAEYGGIEGLVTQCLGDPGEGAAIAGDVVLCHIRQELTLAIYNGSYAWSFLNPEGLVKIARQAVVMHWKIADG